MHQKKDEMSVVLTGTMMKRASQSVDALDEAHGQVHSARAVVSARDLLVSWGKDLLSSGASEDTRVQLSYPHECAHRANKQGHMPHR